MAEDVDFDEFFRATWPTALPHGVRRRRRRGLRRGRAAGGVRQGVRVLAAGQRGRPPGGLRTADRRQRDHRHPPAGLVAARAAARDPRGPRPDRRERLARDRRRRPRRDVERGPGAAGAAAGGDRAALLRGPLRGADRPRPRLQPRHGQVPGVRGPHEPAPSRSRHSRRETPHEHDLAELIHDRLDAVDVPPPDLAAVHRRGDRIRSRRAVGVATAGIAAVVAVGLVVGQVGGGESDPRGQEIAPIGQLDFSRGPAGVRRPRRRDPPGRPGLPGAAAGVPRHRRRDDAVRRALLRRRPSAAPR